MINHEKRKMRFSTNSSNVYRRIVVTLLACFGPFFTYICRLNFSMTINEMVVKDEVLFESNQGYFVIEETPPPQSFFRTEEHTLSWISRSSTRRIILLSDPSLPIDNKTLPRMGRGRSQLEKSSVSALSIEPNSNSNASVNAITNTTKSDPPLKSTKSEPHLLYWTQVDRNDLLGAFFIGYLIFQIPGARAAEIFGPKSIYIVAGLGSGLCSLVFPFASKYSRNIIYAYLIRVLMGASQAAMFPAGYVFICEWLPKKERSQWLVMPTSFSRIGSVLMNLLVPVILSHYNWEMVFYTSGAVTIIWSFIFIIFGSNSPSDSFWISKSELVHIESHQEPRVGTMTQQTSCIAASGFSLNELLTKDTKQSPPSVDWIKMLFNKPIIILALAMFVSEWSNMLLLIKLPGFLGPVLKMDIADIGFWSSCLITVYSLHCPLTGILAAKLDGLEVKWLGTLRVRKLFEVIAHILQGISCLMIAFSNDKVIILCALFIMMLGRATVGGGQCLMPPELSKEYPGTVFAFANTLANTAGVIGPLTLNWLVDDPNDHSSWFNLWIVSAAIFFADCIIFCLFADNQPQNYCRKQPFLEQIIGYWKCSTEWFKTRICCSAANDSI